MAFLAAQTENLPTIHLTSQNSYTFRTDVNQGSVNAAIDEIGKLDLKLEKGKPIYLVLKTPGGSIFDGMRLIEFLRSLDRPIHTVSFESFSMGFSLVQALGRRYVVKTAALMSHPGSTTCQGTADDIKVCLDILTQLDNWMVDMSSARLGIDKEEYKELIRFDKYFIGEEIIKHNIADEFVKVTCSEELKSEKLETITFFGPFAIPSVKSRCPLLEEPLKREAGK